MIDHVPEPIVGFTAFSVIKFAHNITSLPATAGLGGRNLVIITSSKEEQVPFTTVHLNTFIPTPTLINAAIGSLGKRMLPAPERRLQVPRPAEIDVAESAVVVKQISWFGPAFAVIGFWSTITNRESLDALQVPFETDQINMLVPEFKLETDVLGENGSKISPVPEEINQKPSPTIGSIAFNVVLVAHVFKSMPALA